MWTLLDSLIGVLANVDVLSKLPSTDDVLAPLDTCSAVLEHLEWHRRRIDESNQLEELAEIKNLAYAVNAA